MWKFVKKHDRLWLMLAMFALGFMQGLFTQKSCPKAPACPECKECPVVKAKKPLLKTEPTTAEKLDDIGRILNDR